MKITVKLLSILLLVVSLTDCASLTPQSSRSITMAAGVSMVLPPLQDFGRSVEATQLVKGHYGSHTFVFQNRVSLTPDHCRIIALDALGRTAVTIDWTPENVTYSSATWMPSQVRPENILADFVLLNWPKASVQKSLAASGAHLVSTLYGRSIFLVKQEVIHADYLKARPGNMSGNVRYHNLAWGYSLDIQSVEIAK